ncbi:MAG: HAMP domain-containing histidine kinase [bacterium]|nr:HAMP domain-containing histidine kinase [bacterium]
MFNKLMMSMVPEWARDQKEFWEAIRRRNLWFIKLRYGIVFLLTVFLFLTTFIFKINYSETQLIAGVIIIASILFYNFILHRARKYVRFDVTQFNPLYVSLFQMALDLIALLMLVYFTGGIESPLYMQFVFLVIIGSLILPGTLVYVMAAVFILAFTALTALEHYQAIAHHSIDGLLNFPLYNNPYYVGAFLFTFAFMTFTSVYLANGMARQLYKREKDLVDSMKKINAAEKEKQKYIMGIVHEIKTPIVAVASYIDIILQKFLGPIDETIEEKLVRAKNRTDEGIQMINDVLNVSKLTLYDEYDEEDLDIHEIISGVMKRRKASADAHLIKLHLFDKREQKENIKGDKFLLDIAISNLIGNSIKYGVDGGNVEVTITSEKKSLVIEVCDDGVGIPAEELPKIFKEFYRANNVKKIVSEGSGLGLSVVKRIVERHGGTIKAVSPSRMATRDHSGSCFTIELPFQRKEEDESLQEFKAKA